MASLLSGNSRKDGVSTSVSLLGRCNKVAKAGRLNSRGLFTPSSGGWSVDRADFWSLSPWLPHMAEREREFCLSFLFEGSIFLAYLLPKGSIFKYYHMRASICKFGVSRYKYSAHTVPCFVTSLFSLLIFSFHRVL